MLTYLTKPTQNYNVNFKCYGNGALYCNIAPMDCILSYTHQIINTSVMLQMISECYTFVTMCRNIPMYLFDMRKQLTLMLIVAMHAKYVTIVVRRPFTFRCSV
jgi:hypothetical protein